MQKSQLNRLDALRRVQEFLDANATALGNVSKSTSRLDLDTAVTRLVALAAQQDKAVTEATSRTKMKRLAREDLRLQHMQPIAAIAKKKLAGTPAMQDLKLPSMNTSDAALVVKGRAMAVAAAQYTSVFAAQQLPGDFIAQLLASIEEVLKAVAVRTAALSQLNEATKSVKDQLGITRTDVNVLNALVVKQLKGQAGLIAAWKIAKRVRAKPGVPTGTVRPPANLPVPVPVAVPAPVRVPTPTPVAVPPAATAPVAAAA